MPSARSRCLSQPRTLQILAIGFAPLALKGCGHDCTLYGLPTPASNSGVYFRELESPHFSSAAEQRVGRNLSGTRKLQYLAALNLQESCHSVGINERLDHAEHSPALRAPGLSR